MRRFPVMELNVGIIIDMTGESLDDCLFSLTIFIV
jgi:hypothetical protein